MSATCRIENISIFETPESVPAASPGLSKASILVADDETFVAHAAAALLRAEGYQTDVAHCGQQVLDRLRNGSPLPRLVILDIAMPDFDGIEVLRRVRAEPSLRSVSIIMYSAFCDPQHREISERLGADGYVVKSGDWPELLRQVNRVLTGAQ